MTQEGATVLGVPLHFDIPPHYKISSYDVDSKLRWSPRRDALSTPTF